MRNRRRDEDRRNLVLAALANGPLSHGELARAVGTSGGSLTNLLRNMQQRDYTILRDGSPARWRLAAKRVPLAPLGVRPFRPMGGAWQADIDERRALAEGVR